MRDLSDSRPTWRNARRSLTLLSALGALVVAGCNNPVFNRGGVSAIAQDWARQIECLIFPGICLPPQNVVTQHNDNARTGAQLHETSLTPANVAPGQFGLLYDRHVLGTILAQPLYVHGVTTPQGVRNLIIIATSEDVVYAFDADDLSSDTTVDVPTSQPDVATAESTKWIWRTQIGQPHVGDICGETTPPLVGVTSTPVIDAAADTIYVVARDQTGAGGLGHDHLHALRLSTGADLRQIQVSSGPVNGMTFNDQCQRQRPGLLLQNGTIYLGYGTYQCDQGCPNNQPYRGWILGFRASDFSPAGAFTNSASSAEGGMGVWASGNGLAGSSDGSIFYETGNDLPSGAPLTSLGDSFVKLHGDGTSLTLSSHYQPANAVTLKAGDTDLGAGGPMLLPGGKLVGGGKDGRLFVLSQADLNANPVSFQAFYNSFHYGPNPYPYNSPPVYGQDCPSYVIAHPPNPPVTTGPIGGVAYKNLPCWIDPSYYAQGESYGPNIHAGAVFWRNSSTHGFIYKMSEKDYLKAFDYDVATGTVSPTPAHVATVRPGADGMPGGFSSISANGTTNGIVWTVVQQQDNMWGPPSPAILYAHDATNLHELWNNASDQVAFAKFNPPTIADGKVILPSVGLFQVYGRYFTRVKLPPIYVYPPIIDLPPDPAIDRLWSNLGGPVRLGRAVGPRQKLGDGGLRQDFETWIAGGGYGQISVAPGTKILPPMCDDASKNAKADLKVESSIFASRRTGPHYVMGEIRRVFLQQGGVARFGYPVTNEVPTPDGLGLMTRFEKGTVFWYAGSAAQVGEPRPPGSRQPPPGPTAPAGVAASVIR